MLPGSYDLPGSQLLDLVDVMNRLRSPGGCPWDAEQTHDSLKKYLLEETYEVLESIEEGDPQTPGPGRDALVEELGDLLLQVVFHARIAEEHPEDPFSIDDVAEGIVAKLVRRHPHVFGDAEVDDAAHVAADWEANKAKEKARKSVTEGVPIAQPALSLVAKLASRARNAGLEVPLPEVSSGGAGAGGGAAGPLTSAGAAEAAEVIEADEVADITDITDATDIAEATDAAEPTEAGGAGEAGAADASGEAVDAAEAPEAADAAGTPGDTSVADPDALDALDTLDIWASRSSATACSATRSRRRPGPGPGGGAARSRPAVP